MTAPVKIRHAVDGRYMGVMSHHIFGDDQAVVLSIIWTDVGGATVLPRDHAHDLAKTYIALTGDHDVEIEEA